VLWSVQGKIVHVMMENVSIKTSKEKQPVLLSAD